MCIRDRQKLTAYDVVNGWSREEIRRILFEYGEERYASLIAAAIERERADKPIETTLELVRVIKGATVSYTHLDVYKRQVSLSSFTA